jgi:hypothetical protein
MSSGGGLGGDGGVRGGRTRDACADMPMVEEGGRCELVGVRRMSTSLMDINTVRRRRGAHEDGGNRCLDVAVVDGITWQSIEQRSAAAQRLSRVSDGEREEGKGFLASSMSYVMA